MSESPSAEPSYRALLGVPFLGRTLVTMQIARIAQSMVSIVMILFALERYGSSEVAGLVAFAATAPGILVSPIAGALLDRHGRVRLIILDYVIAAVSLSLVAALAWADSLPAALLVAITALASLTGPLSGSGLRSLFPLMVPERLWERVNAVDSNGWVIATVVGAPFGAVLKQTLGAETALVVISVAYVGAALRLAGTPDPKTAVQSTGRIFRDAWLGLRYTWGNRTLRALAVCLSLLNVGGGVMQIVVPLIVTRRLGLSDDVVGIVFGVSGLFGAISAFVCGRIDTSGRERPMILLPTLGLGLVLLLLLAPGGLLPILLMMALFGLVNGPLDIAMFTVRQRRTDQAWMGRAFTISMSLNFSGFPIGAAIGGTLAGHSIEAAILFGVVTGVLAAFFGYLMLPGDAPVAAPSTPAEPDGWGAGTHVEMPDRRLRADAYDPTDDSRSSR